MRFYAITSLILLLGLVSGSWSFRVPTATPHDQIFVFAIAALPICALSASNLIAVRLQRRVHPNRLSVTILSSITLATATWLSWGPFFKNLAGAPLVGFLLVFLAELAIAGSVIIALHVSEVCAKPRDPTRCSVCGYSSVGLLDGAKCPECGTTPEQFRGRH